MNIDTITGMKTKAGIAAALVVVAVGGYAVASWASAPERATVMSAGCGETRSAGNFAVPLRTMGKAAPGVPVTFGPIEYPTAGGLVRLAFDGKIDGTNRQVVMLGDTLQLPVTFGRDMTSPKRIRISCRGGAINNVRYDRGRAGTTFNVNHQELSTGEPEMPSAS